MRFSDNYFFPKANFSNNDDDEMVRLLMLSDREN